MSTSDARFVLGQYHAQRRFTHGPFARDEAASHVLYATAVAVAQHAERGDTESTAYALRYYRIARRWLETCQTRDGIKNRVTVAQIAQAVESGKGL